LRKLEVFFMNSIQLFNSPGTVFVVALVVLIFIVIFKGVKTVPQGFEWTVEFLGRYTRSLRPGLNFIIPFFERVGHRLNMKEQVMDVASQEVISKDNAMIRVDGVVFFQILDASKAAYEVDNLVQASLNLIMTNIRTVMGSMDLDELLSRRDDINSRLLDVVDEATGPWGVKVTRIEIKDITPPQNLVDSMARQMKSERDKRAVVLEAEGERQSEVLRAEGQKRAVILAAEGLREAAFREAEARERQAEAEANATRMVSDAIAGGDINAVNYFVAQKYVEALQNIGSAANGKVIFMPLEASGVIGALGGVAEMLRSGAAPQPADTAGRIAEDTSSTPPPPASAPGEHSGR